VKGSDAKRWLLSTLVLLAFVAAAADRPAAAFASCTGQDVAPGQNLPAAIRAASAGTTFCLSAGVYRIRSAVVMRSGDTIAGVSGTVISGGRRVIGWRRVGSWWIARGAPARPTDAGQGSFPSLLYAQSVYDDDLYLDHRPLWKVGVKVGGTVIGRASASRRTGAYFVDYDARTFRVGSDPAGHVLQTAVAPAGIVADGASNVRIRDVSLTEFTGNALEAGRGWIIRRVNVSLAAGIGIRLGPGSTLSGSVVRDNGQYGVTGSGGDVTVARDAVLRNNYHRWSTATGSAWDAGGTKFVRTTHLLVEHCTVNHNVGNGIWLDIDNDASRVLSNRVERNTQVGIDHEISYQAEIAGNTVSGNGSYGIYVSASPHDNVHGNTVRRNHGEIVLRQSQRPQHPSPLGPHIVADTDVFGNLIDLRSSGTWVGGYQTVGSQALFTSRNNRFHDDRILIPSRSATVVHWLGARMTVAEWRAHEQE
jgi:parallel beta-helix repeat protein